jgi:AcrR family transcriptional regulator
MTARDGRRLRATNGNGRTAHKAIHLSGAPALTAKGERTRQQIVEGAWRAFEKSRSYVDTRIADIAREAGVAYGSFYTYFKTKEEIFYHLANSVVDELYVEGTSSYRGPDAGSRVDSANRQFLASYRKHAVMMTIIEQAAALYPEFHELRRRLRGRFVERIAANIARWRDAGLTDPDLDAELAAHALVSMTDNFSYVWFVLGEPFDEEKAAETVTRIWANALGLPHPRAVQSGRSGRRRP